MSRYPKSPKDHRAQWVKYYRLWHKADNIPDRRTLRLQMSYCAIRYAHTRWPEKG